MARTFCLVALLAGLVAAPGCSCMGGGNTCSSSRRPSFMEFGGCLGGCGSSPQQVYAAPIAAPCSAPACNTGCDTCGGAAAAPCCNDGAMVH
jgi:hypothetical protein